MANRNMAVKHAKAKAQRADFCGQIALKNLANEKPMTDQAALVACLARGENVTHIGNAKISRCDDINARKASRKTIRAVHW